MSYTIKGKTYVFSKEEVILKQQLRFIKDSIMTKSKNMSICDRCHEKYITSKGYHKKYICKKWLVDNKKYTGFNLYLD